MHENINIYKNKQIEYREYIETWVHEIKTPIASTKLVIENNRNNTTDKIYNQIKKIENFVEQVLYYSKKWHSWERLHNKRSKLRKYS